MEESQNKEISAALFNELVSNIAESELDCLDWYGKRNLRNNKAYCNTVLKHCIETLCLSSCHF